MATLQHVIEQLKTARKYTDDLLNHVEATDWFRFPDGGITHIAWQAGHLAICEYGLALKRIRGVRPEDADLFPQNFGGLFGKGSTPVEDPSVYPNIADLRHHMRTIHDQTVAELSGMEPALFDEPTSDPPHPMFRTKLGALEWCVQHEFLHAGQIGLLRRMLGKTYLR